LFLLNIKFPVLRLNQGLSVPISHFSGLHVELERENFGKKKKAFMSVKTLGHGLYHKLSPPSASPHLL
jgi:hypothetical protein